MHSVSAYQLPSIVEKYVKIEEENNSKKTEKIENLELRSRKEVMITCDTWGSESGADEDSNRKEYTAV